MPFVLPADPAAGNVAPASWGDAVRDALNYLANPPGCRVYHNANQSIADNLETTVAFNSERVDTDAMHDTVTNNSRITIKTAGLYVVTFHGQFENNSDYQASIISLRLNGATVIARGSDNGVSDGGGPSIHVSTVYKCAVNDYIEARAYHNNTGNTARNLLVIGNWSPEFAAVWVGLG